MDLGVADDGERTSHKQAAQIAVTLLTDMPSLFKSKTLLSSVGSIVAPGPSKEVAKAS